MAFQTIIGLEIHVQLKTQSKMFCSCSNKGENEPPNTTICPICTGHPGTLPTINQKAVEWAIKTALALNCEISPSSKFDRKNYFYPDLPKGYQISQYDQPLGKKGWLTIENAGETRTIRIRRLHLEEDAAKNFHSADGHFTLVDYNRAGTPLIEIVTEPDIRSPEEAKIFLQELRLIMRYLDVSDADMEKGHLRCDANINIWEVTEGGERVAATPIVEVKNMNSFRSVERALAFEVQRQMKMLRENRVNEEGNGKTTRGWNEETGKTEPQRIKEEAHDYRYFPEPDLPPMVFAIDEKNSISIESIQQSLPELPQQKRIRFEREFGISPSDARILTENPHLAHYTEQVVSELEEWMTGFSENDKKDERWNNARRKAIQKAVNWIIHKFIYYLKKDGKNIQECKMTPENFAEFITLLLQNRFNTTVGQTIFEIMYQTGKDPSSILEEENLSGTVDEKSIGEIIQSVLLENLQAVQNYQKGKTNAIMFLVGQVMKKTRGKTDPQTVKKLLENKLRKSQ